MLIYFNKKTGKSISSKSYTALSRRIGLTTTQIKLRLKDGVILYQNEDYILGRILEHVKCNRIAGFHHPKIHPTP